MWDASLVGGEEGVIPFRQILVLRKQDVELGVDNISNLGWERFREAVQSLPESDKLGVQGRVGGVNRMGRL